MKVVLSNWSPEQSCTWCEKIKEVVMVTFDDDFLRDSPLCFPCLQKAMRVRSRVQASPGASKATKVD